MTRKGALAGFSYFAGLFLAAYGWGKYDLIFICTVVVMSLIGFVVLKKHRRAVCLCALCVLLGIGYSFVYTKTVYDKTVALDGKTVTVSGYIKDHSYLGSDICLVTVKGKIDGIKGQISFYMPYDEFDYYDRITVKCKVSKISDNMNFLSEEYNRPNGVYLQGKTVESCSVGKSVNPLFREIMHYRDRSAGKLKVYCGEEEAGFLTAMLCGDRSELTANEKSDAYRSGIGHLLAVSGTHLIIISEIFSFFLKRLRSRKKRFFLLMLSVWGFAVFAGMSVSVLRAALLLTFTKSAFLFGRKGDTANSLGICAVILTVGSPYSVRSASFLLTMTASFTMGVIVPKYLKKVKLGGCLGKIIKTLLSFEILTLVMLPFNLILFGGVCVVAPVSNLIIAPLCTLAMYFGFAFLALGGGDVFSRFTVDIADTIMSGVLKLSKLFSEIKFGYIFAKYELLDVIMIACSVIWLVYAVRSKSIVKTFSLVLSMLLAWCAVYNSLSALDDTVELCVIPSGKKCEYVLYSKDCCVIFDCETKGKNYPAVQRYLDHVGADLIDEVFISGGVYNISEIRLKLYYEPEFIFADSDNITKYNVNSFENGSKFNDGMLWVQRTDEGYNVEFDGDKYELCSDRFMINGKEINTSKEKYPLIADLNTKEVRRVSYGFD